MQVYDIHLNKQRREKTRHGSFALPLAVYTTVIRRNVLGFVNWHWHEELQFCLVTRGAVEFHVSETVLSLSPGQGIFINAGQLHMARDGDGQGAYLCLDFHPRLIAGMAGGAVEREMAQFIHDHFDQELTLDQIAASAALSPGACCRLFKRHMGCSPFTYVQNLRLQRAARLLETTDEPITQVAARCGYGSPSYFTKSFREKTGLSPSAYRKRLPGEDPRD